MTFWLPPKASKLRLREAEAARRNRAEIVAARSQGQATRRDLIKWGAITASGTLVARHGLSPFVSSAFADGVPTGCPPSPQLSTAQPFVAKFLRFTNLTRIPMVSGPNDPRDGTRTLVPAAGTTLLNGVDAAAQWGDPAMRMANTRRAVPTVNVVSDPCGPAPASSNPTSAPDGTGPVEGRPPGEWFAHERWTELVGTAASPNPVTGFLLSYGQIADNTTYFGEADPGGPAQLPNSVWTRGEGAFVRGALPPVLAKARYGESVIVRDCNNLPFELANNGGFGRQEPSTHNHNGHNGAPDDGAQNSFFFPGQYYDYHWSLMLARADVFKNKTLTDSIGQNIFNLRTSGASASDLDPRKASGPDDHGGLVPSLGGGDPRELQGTLWFHDHRFFFTAENVYKGFAAMLNYYSGPDRGFERATGNSDSDAVNLRLPSGFLAKNPDGTLKKWGNQDFDVNLLIQDVAFCSDGGCNVGQLFFDIFDTDGFLGDVLHVNFRWKPVMQVMPRKYRFRILSAGMSRWIGLQFADSNNPNTAQGIPLQFIANDGNLFPQPVFVPNGFLGKQGTAERFDVVVDFSKFGVGQKCYLVNLLQFSNGRKPDGFVTLSQALSGASPDPAVGAILRFDVVDHMQSVDDPTKTLTLANCCGAADQSQVPSNLIGQIHQVAPVRTRTLYFNRGASDAGLPFDRQYNGDPWGIDVQVGSDAPSATLALDARRSSNLPRPGDIENWTFLNGGGGWDHPIHLHFEEALFYNRIGGEPFPPWEQNKRKDVWRLGQGGAVQFQVMFGEYGGAYVNHCHNTVHEDNAMLIRYDLIADPNHANNGFPTPVTYHAVVLPTPDPRPEGVVYVRSCSLQQGRWYAPSGFPESQTPTPSAGFGGPTPPGVDPGSGQVTVVNTGSYCVPSEPNTINPIEPFAIDASPLTPYLTSPW